MTRQDRLLDASTRMLVSGAELRIASNLLFRAKLDDLSARVAKLAAELGEVSEEIKKLIIG